MKKVALSFLALILAGTMAFAADVAVAVPANASVSASGSTTFTYSLSGLGFKVTNDVSASISLALINGGSASKGTVGTITIGDINLKFDGAGSGTNLSVALGSPTAKIVLGDLWIKIAGATDPSISYANDVVYFDGALGDGSSIKVTDVPVTSSAQASASGYQIGYKLPGIADLTFGLGVDSAAFSTAHTFEYSAEANVTAVEKLTLGFGYLGGTATGAASVISAKVGYDLGIANIQAGVDMAGSSLGVIATVDLPIMDGLKISNATSYNTGLDDAVKVSVGKALLGIGSLDIGYQLTGSKIYAALAADVADGISAYVKTTMASGTYVNAGVALSKVLDNVTFNIDYVSGLNFGAGTVAVKAGISL